MTVIRNALAAGMRPSETKVAEFILNNPRKAVMMTISELAEISDVSESTVSRLCGRLKLRGFQDLKVRISLSLGQQESQLMNEVSITSGSGDNPISRYVSLVNRSLTTLQESLSAKALQEASNAISKCSYVSFYGAGGSGVSAMAAKYLFFRLGWKCDAFTDVHTQLMSAALLGDQDVAVIISQSGSTSELLSVAERIRKSGATIICITGHENSPISKKADICLTYYYGEEPVYGVESGALLNQISTLQILASAVHSASKDAARDAMRRTTEAVVERFL